MRLRLALLSLLLLGAFAAVAQAHGPGEPASPTAPARMAAVKSPTTPPPARSLAAANGTDKRYALANGCYALRSQSAGRYVAKAGGGYRTSAGSVGAAEGFRMQATALGRYLFYGKNRDFMAGTAQNAVAPAGQPSPSADWRVDVGPGSTFKITLPSSGKALGVSGDALVLTDPGSAGERKPWTGVRVTRLSRATPSGRSSTRQPPTSRTSRRST